MGVFYQLSNMFDEPHADLAPIVAIGFSAGVVGLAGALSLWQQRGGKVARFFAVDGWGVPVMGLPVCRLSHDAFTHWSSLPLGAGNINFYAEPAVGHLDIWGKSTQVNGWQVKGWQPGGTAGSKAMTAADFLAGQLQKEWDEAELR
ncbi:MAG: hypothetical protein HLUCCA11_01755 [Phormidesmis priestleyi Ana]|uniref:Uncharacterized protein n=1 Tax=Phormidesmis priestleyi Ana TaxID=1666911 RepID=A0A0N8KNQ3_9CYAN|nr:MAG: hypothetical protein HLUCCA11_01755 [Phormidesmis priestleyi Ana]